MITTMICALPRALFSGRGVEKAPLAGGRGWCEGWRSQGSRPGLGVCRPPGWFDAFGLPTHAYAALALEQNWQDLAISREDILQTTMCRAASLTRP